MATNPKAPQDPILLARARAMRRESAPAEQLVWRFLRDRQLGGYTFRRQHRYRVVRFFNTDVFDDLPAVLEAIYGECERLSTATPPHPNLLPEGEGTRGAR